MIACALFCSACVSCSGSIPCTVPVGNGSARTPLPPPKVPPCDAQGWCWENPLPFRDGVDAVWHRSDQTVVASSRGHILRLRGDSWQALPALPKADASEIPNVNDLWADGDTLVVAGAVGTAGVIWIHDGKAWTTHPFGRDFVPAHVWGTRRNEVMAVGLGGARRWNGVEWTEVTPPRQVGQGVWGCSDTFWAGFFQGNVIDEEAVIARFDGKWTKTGELPEVNVQFSAISGTSPSNVFAAGIVNGANRNVAWHFDGKRWADLALPESVGLLDLVALGDKQALAAGLGSDGKPRIWRYDGSAWTVAAERGVLELSVATTEDILARTNLNIDQFDGSKWFQPFPLPLDSALNGKNFTAIWGDGSNTIFLAANDGSIFRREGAAWVAMAHPEPVARQPLSMWGTSADNVFVVGQRGLIWHWNGLLWSEMSLPLTAGSTTLRAVTGVDASNIYAVGDSGVILKFDGSSWTQVERVSQDLTGVWASSATDVWAVGTRGLLVHFNGSTWDDNAQLPGSPRNVIGIWGTGHGQLFAAGGDKVYGFTGVEWTETALPTAADAKAIWGRNGSDVFVVGTNGLAFHYDGTKWNNVRAEHPWTFNALWGTAAELRAVGDLGTISVRDR